MTSIPADGNAAGKRHQKLLDDLAKAERKMIRYFRAWARAKTKVDSSNKRLDRLFHAKCEEIEPPLGESKQAKRFVKELGLIQLL